MSTHETRPEFSDGGYIPTPRGKSPQRVIQRPRIPDPTWTRALEKAHRTDRPIGHVIAELLDQWLEEDE